MVEFASCGLRNKGSKCGHPLLIYYGRESSYQTNNDARLKWRRLQISLGRLGSENEDDMTRQGGVALHNTLVIIDTVDFFP